MKDTTWNYLINQARNAAIRDGQRKALRIDRSPRGKFEHYEITQADRKDVQR